MSALLAPIDASLRRAHIAVLVAIAICAALSAVQTGVDPEPAPDPFFTTVAIALAIAVVFTRQAGGSRVAPPRARLSFTLIAYASAAALAVVGAYLAISQGAVRTGLAFSIGAGILIARPPPRLAPSET